MKEKKWSDRKSCLFVITLLAIIWGTIIVAIW